MPSAPPLKTREIPAMPKPQKGKASDLRAETVGEAQDLISEAKVVHALCMLRKHDWPEWKLVPYKGEIRLPAGYRVGPIRTDGLLDITEYCTRGCGEYVTYLVRPDELFGIGIKRNYHRPKDRPVIARGISRGVWAMPLQKALYGPIMAAAQQATEAADRGAARYEAGGAR
jgi:hypothetical protein